MLVQRMRTGINDIRLPCIHTGKVDTAQIGEVGCVMCGHLIVPCAQNVLQSPGVPKIIMLKLSPMAQISTDRQSKPRPEH